MSGGDMNRVIDFVRKESRRSLAIQIREHAGTEIEPILDRLVPGWRPAPAGGVPRSCSCPFCDPS